MHQVYALILAAIASGIIYIEAPVGSSAVTASCTISPAYRTGTTLTAPAFVHIECTATTHTDTDVREFHDLRYVIDYNDDACASGSGSWTNSDTGALKNREISPVGGHVYECAGTYTMEVSACDATNDCDTWTSASFEVQSEDAGYPTTATLCVAAVLPVAGSGDCPAGASVLASTNYNTSLQRGAGTRTLYKCGETFDSAANITDTVNATTNNSLIGSYGTQPCKATVSLTSSHALHEMNAGWAGDEFGLAVSGWKVRDIIYDGSGVTGASEALWNVYGGGTGDGSNKVNMLFLRMEGIGITFCPTIGNPGASSGAYKNERVAFVSTHCLANDPSTADSTYILMKQVDLKNGIYVDNLWENLRIHDNSGAGSFRIYYQENTLWAHNTVNVAGADSAAAFHFRESDIATGHISQHIVVSDNLFKDDGAEASWSMALWIRCGGGANCAPPGVLGHDYIIEGNTWVYGSTYRTNPPGFVVENEKGYVTIRNNIVDFRPFSSSTLTLSVFGASVYGVPNNLRIYNNTVVRSGSGAAVTQLCHSPGGTGHVCRNNLTYDTGRADNTVAYGTWAYETNNEHLNASEEGCPFYGTDNACTMTGACAAGVSVSRDCFKLRTAGGGIDAVRDAGFTFPETTAGYAGYVYTDGWGGCRGGPTGGPDGAWDIGAHEYGATACY